MDDKNSAQNLLNEIEEKIMRLKQFPLSGSLVADQVLQNKGYRKLIINKYIQSQSLFELGFFQFNYKKNTQLIAKNR